MNSTDLLQIVSSLGGLLVAVAGFGLVIYQIHQVKHAIYGDTHSKLYSEDFEWVKIFLDHPEIRPYFYANKEITEMDSDYPLTLTVAELLASHFEHVVLQMENLPTHISPRWEDYIKGLYKTSPIIRKHLTEKSSWYSKKLFTILTTQK